MLLRRGQGVVRFELTPFPPMRTDFLQIWTNEKIDNKCIWLGTAFSGCEFRNSVIHFGTSVLETSQSLSCRFGWVTVIFMPKWHESRKPCTFILPKYECPDKITSIFFYFLKMWRHFQDSMKSCPDKMADCQWQCTCGKYGIICYRLPFAELTSCQRKENIMDFYAFWKVSGNRVNIMMGTWHLYLQPTHRKLCANHFGNSRLTQNLITGENFILYVWYLL